MMKTLYNLSDLRTSRFGRPPPRHGLNLLWWFAQDCVRIDSNGQMIAQCDPENGAFGFHKFYNACNLLPYSYVPYYAVGNLHSTNSLPDYVTAHYTGYSDESNTDRLIVSYNSGCNMFGRIYVTRHSGETSFDQNHTYCISFDLLKEIKRLNRNEFIREMMNARMHVPYNYNMQPQFRALPQSMSRQTPHQSECDDCTCCAIFALVVIVACLLLFSFMIKH